MDGKQIICCGCMAHVPQGIATCPYCGKSFANTNPAGTLPVGTLLVNRYTIDACIALDGEGALYCAVDNDLSRNVNIKEYVPVTICAARTREGAVLPKAGQEVLFKTTRMDFAELYRGLVAIGPQMGLAQVYDVVEANNTAYAVREPEQGIPFEAYMQQRREPLLPAEAVTLLRGLVYGISALHAKGMVHRGISSETVYITNDGKAKLYGYATLGLRTQGSELRAQLYEGYAAPEKYSVAEFDGVYTDVYALGALFYRTLTGETPASAALRVQTDTLLAPRTLEPSLPAYVSNAILRAMRLNPNERMQDVQELLQDIIEPAPQEPFRLTERQMKYAMIAAASLLLVCLIAVVAIISSKIAVNKQLASQSSSAAISQSISQSASSVASASQSVSAADNIVTVPNFNDLKFSDVSAEHSGTYVFEKTEEFNSKIAQGNVIRQSPTAGTRVEKGTKVSVVVSKGGNKAIVPYIEGVYKNLALQQLDALGIKYTVENMVNDGTYLADAVAKMSVPAGTEIDLDTTNIVVYVAGTVPVSSSSSPPASSAPPVDPGLGGNTGLGDVTVNG